MTKLLTKEKLKHIIREWEYPLLILGAMIIKLMKVTPDSDAHALINIGRYIVHNGFPKTNPFVVHSGFKAIFHESGVCLLNFLAYDLLGYLGLFILAVLMAVCAAATLTRYASLYTGEKYKARLIGYLATSILVFTGAAQTRPFLFDVSFMSLALSYVKQSRDTKNWKYLMPVVEISLLQANFHGAVWPFIVCIACIPLVPTHPSEFKGFLKPYYKENKAYLQKVALFILLTIVVGFANPYGADGILYLFKSFGTAKSFSIGELGPFGVPSLGGQVLNISFVVVCFYFYFTAKRDKNALEIPELFTFAAFWTFAMMHQRNIMFLAIAIVPILAHAMENLNVDEESGGKSTLKPAEKVFVRTVCCSLWALALLYVFISEAVGVDNFGKNIENAEALYPVEVADYLDEYVAENDLNKATIGVFTHFNDGHYMMFRGYRVYFNAQPELYSDKVNGVEDVASEYNELLSGKLDYAEFLDKYKFDFIVSTDESMFAEYLRFAPDTG